MTMSRKYSGMSLQGGLSFAFCSECGKVAHIMHKAMEYTVTQMRERPMTPPLVQTTMIDSDAALGQACRRWSTLPFVALDTEFVRTETFLPIAGLVQVGDGQQTWLIDPLKIHDWQPFAQLLENPAVVKVLHACSEDLEVFRCLCDTAPVPLFDTQLAAAFLGMDYSMGYSRLVQALLDIELPKDETRSDWLQRPLSATQLEYAARDAQHLAELYQVLAPRLQACGRTDWLFEDTAQQIEASCTEVEPELAYQQVKQAWRLNPQQLAVLRELAAWRESEARRRNQSRNRLLRERSMIDLAQRQPDSLQALARIEDMHPRTVRHEGARIVELIRQAAGLPRDSWPAQLAQPLSADANRLVKRLRQVGEQKARELCMAAEVMLRRKTIENMVREGWPNGPYQLPDDLVGWRRELLGEQLLAEVDSPVSESA